MSGAELVLILHSFTRWWVLALSMATTLVALAGALNQRAWRAGDQGIARLFVASVDVQLLLGLSLYWGVSPLARAARALWASEGFRALWAERELRFFGVIHPTLALLAACAAHAGWVAARRTQDGLARHRRMALGASLALGLFLAAIPWPSLGHERPWFRF
jgi:hypothetical protein